MFAPASRDLLDQVGVPGPVEDADRHVGDAGPLGLGDAAQVLRRAGVDVDHVGAVRADGDLLHVEDRARVEHRAALGHREHRQRARHALAHQRGAVDRVDRDVHLGAGAVADLLAVEQHRGFVLLALADHHDAAHRDRVDQLAHGVDGGAVAAVLVAAADPAAGRHRGGLGDPDQVEGDVAVEILRDPGAGHGGLLASLRVRVYRSSHAAGLKVPPAATWLTMAGWNPRERPTERPRSRRHCAAGRSRTARRPAHLADRSCSAVAGAIAARHGAVARGPARADRAAADLLPRRAQRRRAGDRRPGCGDPAGPAGAGVPGAWAERPGDDWHVSSGDLPAGAEGATLRIGYVDAGRRPAPAGAEQRAGGDAAARRARARTPGRPAPSARTTAPGGGTRPARRDAPWCWPEPGRTIIVVGQTDEENLETLASSVS